MNFTATDHRSTDRTAAGLTRSIIVVLRSPFCVLRSLFAVRRSRFDVHRSAFDVLPLTAAALGVCWCFAGCTSPTAEAKPEPQTVPTEEGVVHIQDR